MRTTITKSLARPSFLLAAALALTPAIGATVTWDTSTTAGFQSGNGTWGTDSFWSSNGTTLSPWVSGDAAVFLGETTAVTNTITVGSAQNISGLSFGSATTFGNWTFSGSGMNLSANSIFTVNAGSTAAIGNLISGAFSLTKAGTGSLTLTGTNTYTGATTVSAGTLTLASGATMSAGALSVASGASLVLNASATTSTLTGSGAITIGTDTTFTLNTTAGNPQFLGTFSGAGSLVKSGAGEVFLTGDNSGFTGAITINGGMISVQNSISTLGSGDITVTANATIGTYTGGGFTTPGRLNNKLTVTAGTLTLGRNGRTILGNDVIASGTGSIVVGGGGTTVIEKDIGNTGTGALSVASGTTLQLGNVGTTGTFNGGLSFNQSAGNLAFNRSDNINYTGVLSGTGSLTQAGTGNLTLTGANTYTGTTTVSAGTLTLARVVRSERESLRCQAQAWSTWAGRWLAIVLWLTVAPCREDLLVLRRLLPLPVSLIPI
ncbi:MAG: autotransporter-associated beta strand repeat-containing protein [Verrucomicrobia bacterium]|nr:autotransporter-associated beta strand repeat-containing protein [Verrucomicrobiota bacterium]